MRTNAPRTRSWTRVCKNQKISLHFSRVSSPHPSTAKRKKKWKGNFWFCFAVSVSEKSTISLSLFGCSFLRPHGDRGTLLSAFCGCSKLCAFDGVNTNSSKWSLAIQNSFKEWRGANPICVCPTHPCAHIILAVLKKNYKTAGMAPSTAYSKRKRCYLLKKFVPFCKHQL